MAYLFCEETQHAIDYQNSENRQKFRLVLLRRKRTHQNFSPSEANKHPSTAKASLAIISIVVDDIQTLESCSSSRYGDMPASACVHVTRGCESFEC